MELLFLLVGCVLGFVIAFLFFKSKNNVSQDTSVLDNKIIDLEKDKLVVITNLANVEKELPC